MVMHRSFREFWSRQEKGVRRSPCIGVLSVERIVYPCERKRARSEAFRAVTGDEKEVV